MKNAATAAVGDMVDPGTLPASVVKEGGGWVNGRYFCAGTHKDGASGWRCIEVRSSTPFFGVR